MADIKKTLTKKDFCKPDCSCENWNDNIYPSTTTDQVVFGDTNLDNWLGEAVDYENIIKLIEHYTDGSGGGGGTDPHYASKELYGIVKIGDGIDVENGIISINLSSYLTEIPVASNAVLGGIKLFSSEKLTLNSSGKTWSEWAPLESGTEVKLEDMEGIVKGLPIYLNNDNKAYAVIPETWLSNVSLDNNTFDYLLSKETGNDNLHVNNYNRWYLGNKTIPTNNGMLGKDVYGNTSTSYGYPRFAIKSGLGIVFDKNVEATSLWNHAIDSLVIGLNIANSSEIGGMKLGYVSTKKKKAVQLDVEDRAYVNLSSVPFDNYVFECISQHAFIYNTTIGQETYEVGDNYYVPLIETEAASYGYTRSVTFEIVSRYSGTAYYAKYKFETVGYDVKLYCLDFYSKDTNKFSINDVVAVVDTNNTSKYTIYRLNHATGYQNFLVNILAENDTTESEQHYYYTFNQSTIAESGYNNPTPIQTLYDPVYPETYNTQKDIYVISQVIDSETEEALKDVLGIHYDIQCISDVSQLMINAKANTKQRYIWMTNSSEDVMYVNISGTEDSKDPSNIIITPYSVVLESGDDFGTLTQIEDDTREYSITVGAENTFTEDYSTLEEITNLIITITNNIIKINKGTWNS